MTLAYKVYDSNHKLVDVFGRQQLCDFATEQICENKGAYTQEEILNTPVVDPKEMVKIQVIVRKVTQQNEYVATVEQSKLALKVIHYTVKEVKLY